MNGELWAFCLSRSLFLVGLLKLQSVLGFRFFSNTFVNEGFVFTRLQITSSLNIFGEGENPEVVYCVICVKKTYYKSL